MLLRPLGITPVAPPIERLFEIRAEKIVLLAVGFHRPVLSPVLVGLRILLDVLEKASLFTPAHENMTVTESISSLGVFSIGTRARWAISASPVASMMRLARIAWRPDLLCTMIPRRFLPSRITSTASEWRSGRNPLSIIQLSATTLNISPLMAWLSDWGSGRAAEALARSSNSMPIPSTSTVPFAVPGNAFYAHVRQIAAETAVTLHNHRLDTGPRS